MERRTEESKVYKYTLDITDRVDIAMPAGSDILCVQIQYDKPTIWARVDPAAPTQMRTFAVYGTGHPMFDAPQNYIGTVQIHGGSLVFHVFELLK